MNVYVIRDIEDALEVYGVIVSKEDLYGLIDETIDEAKEEMMETNFDGYDTDFIFEKLKEALAGHQYSWADDYNMYI